MVHVVSNTILCTINQGPLNGKECPGKDMIILGQVLHDLVNYPVDREVQGLITHTKLITPVIYVLCDGPLNLGHL